MLSVKNIVTQSGVENIVTLVARILMAYIFYYCRMGQAQRLWRYSGLYGIDGCACGIVTRLTILVEFGGGLALLFGFQARLAAFGLGIFSIITAFIFHGADDQMQQINFMKNLAMSGGLFYLMLHGAGRLSLDHVIEK